MSDKQLGHLVKECVTRSEPEMLTTADDIVVAARRSRVRGWIVMGSAAALVATIALVGGALFSLGSRSGEPQVAVTGQFSPDGYASSISRAVVESTGGTAFVDSDVRAFDAQDNPIEGADRDKATVWRGTFQRSDAHYIEVYAIHSASETEGNAAAECQADLKAELLMSCTVTSRDGVQLVFSEGTVRRMGNTWPAWTGSEDIPGAGKDVWFMHKVEVNQEDNLQVAVFEVVRADTYEAARALWEVDDQALASLVTRNRSCP